MYERSYGSKYNKGDAYRNAADIAKDMRADIKALQKDGKLSKDLKVSVTVDNYSMGRSIDIKVPYSPDFWVTCAGHVPGSEHIFDDGESWAARACPNPGHRHDESYSHEVLSIEGQRVKKLLDGVHWAYNYDGSEVQVDYFDTNYYGHVTMLDRQSQEWADKERARKAGQRQDAKAKGELIDHLLADHALWRNFRPLKRGNLRQWSYERLQKAHAEQDHGPEGHVHA